jgi:hypothetical protein
VFVVVLVSSRKLSLRERFNLGRARDIPFEQFEDEQEENVATLCTAAMHVKENSDQEATS